MARLVISVFVVLAALYVVMLIAARQMQERIVWQPPRMAQYPAADTHRLDYSSDDGQPLFAYLIGDPARAPVLLIAHHGNADLAAIAAELSPPAPKPIGSPRIRKPKWTPALPVGDGLPDIVADDVLVKFRFTLPK